MPKMMIVEDNPGDADLIVACLANVSLDLDIEVCGDGDEALTRLRRDPFDLVLVDWHVPRRNGCELLTALREDPLHRRTPLVVMSSSDAPPDVAAAYDLGASGYIVKPSRFSEFSERIVGLVNYWFGIVCRPPRSPPSVRA